jgi:hypothetical protein
MQKLVSIARSIYLQFEKMYSFMNHSNHSLSKEKPVDEILSLDKSFKHFITLPDIRCPGDTGCLKTF